MLLLDGMDEAGACRELLEAYVSCRLVTEVHLCVTARPQGIANMHLFEPFFVGVRVEPLRGEVVVWKVSVRSIAAAISEACKVEASSCSSA